MSAENEADAAAVSPAPSLPLKFGRSKPTRSSSLRRSINVEEVGPPTSSAPAKAPHTHAAQEDAGGQDEDEDAAVSSVVRPAIGRSGSTKGKKKRPPASRLSFGPDNAGDAAETSTPGKPLGQRALENHAARRTGGPLQNLAVRFGGGEEERPRYSKEYLEELQSSTPNTPQNLASLRISDDRDGEMDLDPSELDGAIIVPAHDLSVAPATGPPLQAKILTELEVREKKERRARLALEAESIPLGSDDEADGTGTMSLDFEKKKQKKKKPGSRLVAEDEDLGEGYDEFVSDGRLALGRKAERHAAKQQRQEMEDMIRAAEVGSDAESDDSESERRAAYEAAQWRAGMDGLKRLGEDGSGNGQAEWVATIPKLKPLPQLEEVMQRLRDSVRALEQSVAAKQADIAQLERDKQDLLAREQVAQDKLNVAGEKYQACMAGHGHGPAVVNNKLHRLAADSPLQMLPGMGGDGEAERGLESFGTPTKQPEPETL
ncbi:hypothetical protein P8C59_002972 [Phyllachora maydis]|uniref:Uncharacterized protein n=1 Tax=Phyllachora maydis TaxID=1825666 RepID=A0AAD9I0N6_9PEZI|nr:hypothetical protein P8C59_002972 [Phyllachora maydis]